MLLVRKNVLSNFAGQITSAAVGLLVVPFYLRYLGQEGYGLISFYLSIQAITTVLDFGLSTAANREISRFDSTSYLDARHLIRSLEWCYFCVAVLLAGGFWYFSGAIASTWLHSSHVSREDVQSCVVLAGFAISLRWPIALYAGVLRGVERQFALNCVASGMSVLRALVAVLVLVLVSKPILAFFSVQLVLGAVETFFMAVVVWRHFRVCSAAPASFRMTALKRVWRFAWNVGWASALAMVLKQLDRILISKMLPLDQLGNYAAASLLGAGVAQLVFYPIQSAVFPRLSRLVAAEDVDSLARVFHRSCQAVAFIAAPLASLLIFYSEDVLLLWTRSRPVAVNAAGVLSILSLAMLFNSMMSIPYALQLAAGLTRLPLLTNAVGVLCLGPCMYFLILRYEITGGAAAWLLFNIAYYAIVPHIMFRYVLQRHKHAWFIRDTLQFIVIALSVFGAGHLISLRCETNLRIPIIFLSCIIYMVIAGLASPAMGKLITELCHLRLTSDLSKKVLNP